MNERRLYLVRHGTPRFPHNERHYYSRTDYILSDVGEEDARLTAEWLKRKLTLPFHFYSSPLLRSRHTAEALTVAWPEAGPPDLIDDLMELDCGVWEGMLLSDIEKRYPDAFSIRGEDPALYTPPEGESHEDCQTRVFNAIERIVRTTEHDVVIVAHAMVNLLFLAKALDWPITGLRPRSQPFGGFNVLNILPDGYEAVALGQMPTDAPSELKIRSLQDRYRMPEAVRRHTAAVRALALDYASRVNETRKQSGERPIDLALLGAAADLHDIARGEPKHALAGAKILAYEGYPAVASVIADHQDLPEEKQHDLDESSLLYLADKNVLEDDVVGIEARFNDSYYVCDTPKAKRKHAKRKAAAIAVQNRLEQHVTQAR